MGVAIGAAIAGAGLLAGSGVMGANASKKKEEKFKNIANTPGLDFGEITRSALGGYESNYGAASSLSRKLALTNQEQLGAQEEMALPGIAAMRQKALGKIGGLFDEDSAWLQGVQRRGAALGLSSGLMGSQAGQIGTLRLSDRESMQRTQLGTGLLGSLIGGMRLANSPGTQAFLGPTISEQVNQRSLERTQRMNMLANAAGIASGKEQGAGMMGQVGGMLLGGGLLGMGGGGGGMTSPGNWTGSSLGLGSAPQGWNSMPLYMQQQYMNQAQNAQTYGAGIDFT